MKRPFPVVSAILSIGTLLASATVALIVTGVPWGTVRILQLLDYGAVNNAHLANLEWWRLLSAQFVHVKPAHMLFNVIALFLLGICVERCIGSFRLAALWLASGVIGTYASMYWMHLPYDVGSGASQGLAGVAGAAAVILRRRLNEAQWLKGVLVVTLAVVAGLDLVFSSTIKPGHLVGFLVGLIGASRICVKAPKGGRSRESKNDERSVSDEWTQRRA